MVNWSDTTAKNYQNPMLERIYGKFADRLNALSPELAQANADHALLRAFQKNEGLRRILKPGDNIDTASSALRNYNSTVTKGNANRNIQDLEKLMAKEGYSPFLNNIDDVNAAMDLLNTRTTGDSWLSNLATQTTRPVLKAPRGVNRRMENIPQVYKNIGAEIPEAIRRLMTLGAVCRLGITQQIKRKNTRVLSEILSRKRCLSDSELSVGIILNLVHHKKLSIKLSRSFSLLPLLFSF